MSVNQTLAQCLFEVGARELSDGLARSSNVCMTESIRVDG